MVRRLADGAVLNRLIESRAWPDVGGAQSPRPIPSQSGHLEEPSMDFRLTDEQNQIKTMVREFAESEIKPHLSQWDEAQHFPVDTFRKAGELGMLGVTIPEEYGGAGGGVLARLKTV